MVQNRVISFRTAVPVSHFQVEAGKEECASHKGYGFFFNLVRCCEKGRESDRPVWSGSLSGVEEVLVEVLVVLKFDEDTFLVCRRREL